MLLRHHVDYSMSVMSGISIDSTIKEQIKVGSTANDLCEFTNEYQILLPDKEAIYDIVNSRRKGSLDNVAIYQSNFGNLACLHAMSKRPDEPASTTKVELVAWFEFLNDVALENKTIMPENVIASDRVQISDMFTGETITYRQVFDADGPLTIKYRALGMMLHLIQDAYTLSHCERNESDEVVMFYCYK